MSSYKKRVEALEREVTTDDREPLIIVRNFCTGGHGEPIVSRPGLARVPGVGTVWADEGETKDEFLLRVYAMRIANYHLQDMTGEEREAPLGKADERVAFEGGEEDS